MYLQKLFEKISKKNCVNFSRRILRKKPGKKRVTDSRRYIRSMYCHLIVNYEQRFFEVKSWYSILVLTGNHNVLLHPFNLLCTDHRNEHSWLLSLGKARIEKAMQRMQCFYTIRICRKARILIMIYRSS